MGSTAQALQLALRAEIVRRSRSRGGATSAASTPCPAAVSGEKGLYFEI